MPHRPLIRFIVLLSVILTASTVLVPLEAAAQLTSGERAVIQRKQAVAEAEARQEIESLFSRLCPGRCELIDVNAVISTPKPVGEVTPGFESAGAATFDAKLKRLEARVMIDSNLPNNFRANIPAMLRYRLSSVTPNVVITPTILEFPQPQNPPMPPMLAEPPRRRYQPQPPAAAPEPPEVKPELPKPEEPVVEPEEKPPEEKPTWYAQLWKELLPWIPFILMLVVFFALFAAALKRMREAFESKAPEPLATLDGDGPSVEAMDVDVLRQELRQSRGIQNEVLRQWLAQDPEAVATLVRLVGPEILDDLKQDTTLRPMIEVVSQEVARQSDPVTATESQRLERELRSRIMAAKVLQANKSMSGDWEFLQGITAANLVRVMNPLQAREKSYVLGQLPPALRASYMNQMTSQQRKDLFLGAGSGDVLSKVQAKDLAVNLRKASDDIAHIGAEASGQAAIIVDMLRALALGEQTETLSELRARRPEVAQAVLEQVCLESTILHAPREVVADAMQRTSIDTLSRFMRGTLEPLAQAMLAGAPAGIRGALHSEFDLEIPVSRAEFLESRTEFTTMVATVLRRDGHDLASLNLRALDQPQGPSQQEA